MKKRQRRREQACNLVKRKEQEFFKRKLCVVCVCCFLFWSGVCVDGFFFFLGYLFPWTLFFSFYGNPSLSPSGTFLISFLSFSKNQTNLTLIIMCSFPLFAQPFYCQGYMCFHFSNSFFLLI